MEINYPCPTTSIVFFTDMPLIHEYPPGGNGGGCYEYHRLHRHFSGVIHSVGQKIPKGRFFPLPASPAAAKSSSASIISPATAVIKPVRMRFSAAFSRAMAAMLSFSPAAAGMLPAPFKSSSVDMPKSSLNAIILDISGAASFSSHFDTDWRETSSCSASCSCERPPPFEAAVSFRLLSFLSLLEYSFAVCWV